MPRKPFVELDRDKLAFILKIFNIVKEACTPLFCFALLAFVLNNFTAAIVLMVAMIPAILVGVYFIFKVLKDA